MSEKMSRRHFLSSAAVAGAGLAAILAGCKPTVVEKVVKETVIVAGTPQVVEKVVKETVIVKETVVIEKEATVAAPKAPFTLQMMTCMDLVQPGNKAYVDWVTAEWNKLYPNGKIEHETVGWDEVDTKLVSYVMAGQPLDVGYNWSGATPTWAAMGVVMPLDDCLPQWWWDERLPAMITPPSQALWEGKLYLAALGLELPGMIYRRDVVEEAGIDPTKIETFDDMLAACDAVATKTKYENPYALMMKNAGGALDHTTRVWAGNGLANQADFRPDRSEAEAWIESATYVKKLFEYVDEEAFNWYYDTAKQAWWTDITVFYQHGSWLTGAREEDAFGICCPEKMMVAPFVHGPSLELQSAWWTFNATGFFLMSGAPHAQEACDWIALATSSKAYWAPAREIRAGISAQTDWTIEKWMKHTMEPELEWWVKQWKDLTDNYPAHMTQTGFLARAEISQHLYEGLIKLWRDQIVPEELYVDMREFSVPLLKEAGAEAFQ